MIRECWYIPAPHPRQRRRLPRWVLRATDMYVYYSKGGTAHYFCLRTTFERWVKTVAAHTEPGDRL